MNTHTPITVPTRLESLLTDREEATSPGVKASLTKQINALTGETAIPSASDLPQLPYSKANLKRLVKARKDLTPATSPGVKAALTRHAREMAEGLDLPDPFPVKGAPKASKAALKRLTDARTAATTAGVKASLTRQIRAMEGALSNGAREADTVHLAKNRFIASLTGGGGQAEWRVRDLQTRRIMASDLTRSEARALAAEANGAYA